MSYQQERIAKDVCQKRAYTPYGFCQTHELSSALLGFNGESLDSRTESYLLGQGHRAYSPALMRFIASDELSPFREGGFNSYAYCLNDPINRVDPDGKAGTPPPIRRHRQPTRTVTPTDLGQARSSSPPPYAPPRLPKYAESPPAYQVLPGIGETTAEINLGPEFPINPMSPLEYRRIQTNSSSFASQTNTLSSSKAEIAERAAQATHTELSLVAAAHGQRLYQQNRSLPKYGSEETPLSLSALNARYRTRPL